MLNLAKKAIIYLLKNWSGFIYLGNENQCIKSLILSLKQPIKKKVRLAIFEILDTILNLGNNQLKNHNNSYKI